MKSCPRACPAVGEGVDVLLARTQKTQKVHANVLTGLTDAQENQILTEAFFRSNSSNDAPKRGEWFDGMLCIVVVPRDTVIFEKGEQLVSVLLQARLDFCRSLTL